MRRFLFTDQSSWTLCPPALNQVSSGQNIKGDTLSTVFSHDGAFSLDSIRKSIDVSFLPVCNRVLGHWIRAIEKSNRKNQQV